MENIPDSREEVKKGSVAGVWKKVIPALMDDLKGFKTSVEEIAADVGETARELELEVEPAHVTGFLPSHDRTFTDEDFLLTNEPRKWFPEMESTPGDDAVKIVEMTAKDLEYYVNEVCR